VEAVAEAAMAGRAEAALAASRQELFIKDRRRPRSTPHL